MRVTLLVLVWKCLLSDKVHVLESVVSWTNGVKERPLWRIWFKQLVHIFVQISEGSQCKEQVDSLFLMASRIVSEDCSEYVFCKWDTVSWRVHKVTFVERWSCTRSDCSCITSCKLFYNALSEKDRFILIMLSKHLHAIVRGRGIDTVSYAMTLANHNGGRLLWFHIFIIFLCKKPPQIITLFRKCWFWVEAETLSFRACLFKCKWAAAPRPLFSSYLPQIQWQKHLFGFDYHVYPVEVMCFKAVSVLISDTVFWAHTSEFIALKMEKVMFSWYVLYVKWLRSEAW